MEKSKKLNLSTFFQESFFFIFAYLLSLVLVLKTQHNPQIRKDVNAQVSSINIGSFFLAFFIVTLLFFILLPLFKKRPFFLRTFFLISVLIGLDVTISILWSEPYALIVATGLAALLTFFPRVIVHDILFVAALAGISFMLTLSLDISSIIIVLGILSLYDVAAVYLTKHMVKMASIPARQGVFMGIILPEKKKNYFKPNPRFAPGIKKDFFFLGGGDIVLPLMLPVAIAHQSIVQSAVVFFFLILGILLLNYAFSCQKAKRPMPALPPLVLAVILGYVVALFW